MTDASADGSGRTEESLDDSSRTAAAVRADAGDGSDDEGHGSGDDSDGLIHHVLNGDDETAIYVRDIASVVAVVAVVGLVLFGISGVWPPLVAVESGSMEPNIHKGDMVVLVQEDRFVGDDPVAETGLVTAERGRENGHETFGRGGDVIVYAPNGNPAETPVIHRVHFWVEESENWVETSADPEYTGGRSCAEIRSCPAPHDGFITKGDGNSGYDQLDGEPKTTVVRPEWIMGKATFRIPWLGNIRLLVESLLSVGAVGS
ncbi:S24/S26 family peptidase [Natrinema salaciae]|uniref:Signal peptidase, endoplasmic reticulum-type n=1 Tax=Natrinema salaciae TaxID=1186196 RepID=A0A1H9MYG1_9EURY|nr:S26 family signal peptidase [Natrinema salaciae]SER28750.1 signal peptidase, endoplasmic reticulum-type [Natrinema salaciae]